ncbi:unnamed protein product [Medioppia subpectinata]|uniref:Nose resistant-to-fluoxetine protein N-terminal domain-containing protein n=1 Tax=Medioppia subpectinata TaxID=1979941 RepID=A0A7R9KPD9_9ACAR|nr:unnamed protein product [Medioppia subpectinata]CAG2107209.1 unnamed protein product [Medioppia subpectinata]
MRLQFSESKQYPHGIESAIRTQDETNETKMNINSTKQLIVFIIWFCVYVANEAQNDTTTTTARIDGYDKSAVFDTNTTFGENSDYNDYNSTTFDLNGSRNNDSEETDGVTESVSDGDDTDEDGDEVSFKEPQNPSEFMDYFEDFMQRTKVKLEELFEQYMPQLIQMSSTVTLSPDCTFDAVRILFGLRKLQPWAIKILDSSGKVPDGILGGTLTALGSYDDCLESRIGEEQNEESTKGQYCAINVRPYLPPKPPLDSVEKEFNDAADAKGFAKEHHFARIAPLFYYLKLRLGICLPASCTLNDLHLITKRISHRFRVNVTVQSCDVKQSTFFSLDDNQIIPLFIISVLLVMIAASTVYDILSRTAAVDDLKKVSSFVSNCCASFSVCANSAIILSTKAPDHMIRSLNGMKVISLIWIMIAHTYMTLDFRATGRLVTTTQLPKGFLFQTILNASLAIETFFFLSGVLVAYNTLKKMKTLSNWNLKTWISFYIHRYIRLTPAIMLLIVMFLLAYRMGNGPLWQELIYPTADKCRDNWWTHALYVSNFIKGKDMPFISVSYE